MLCVRTSKTNTMLDHLQVFGAPKFRDQRTATLLDKLRKVHLWLAVPTVLLSTASEDDPAALTSWEDMRGFTVTMRSAEVHLADRLLWTLYQNYLTLVKRFCEFSGYHNDRPKRALGGSL